MEEMMCVCPKCGDIGFGFTRGMCDACKIKVIETETTYDEFMVMDVVEEQLWCRKITEKYVKSNPLFDAQAQDKRLTEEAKEYYEEQHQIKCPTCGSTNIQKISGLERGMSVLTLGLFSKKINKSFKCNHCGMTF